uniref:Uncharacterized protein n=1 Tax=Percolomonas cosmopolitus TaxID=63605 RepID=A0A7S1KS72_9EUKA|mmetsp:Transcript_7320/g.27386  ORF Transcript_7320/g.27386 Transcript_7320/m.27386 type:complete len:292 (+) Transcript_7320:121-996(+)
MELQLNFPPRLLLLPNPVDFRKIQLPSKMDGIVHFLMQSGTVSKVMGDMIPLFAFFLLQRYFDFINLTLRSNDIWLKQVCHLQFNYVSVKYNVKKDQNAVFYERKLFRDLESACTFITSKLGVSVSPSDLEIIPEFRTETMRFQKSPLKMTAIFEEDYAEDEESVFNKKDYFVKFSLPLTDEGRKFLAELGPVHIVDSTVFQKSYPNLNPLDINGHQTIFEVYRWNLIDRAEKEYPGIQGREALVLYSSDMYAKTEEFTQIKAVKRETIRNLQAYFVSLQQADLEEDKDKE